MHAQGIRNRELWATAPSCSGRLVATLWLRCLIYPGRCLGVPMLILHQSRGGGEGGRGEIYVWTTYLPAPRSESRFLMKYRSFGSGAMAPV